MLIILLKICVSFRTFQGRTPVLLVNEVDAIKQMTIKQFQKFTNRRPFLGDIGGQLFDYTLTSLNNDHWKHLRTVLTPTFTSGKLKSVSLSTLCAIPAVLLLVDACVKMLKHFLLYRCFVLQVIVFWNTSFCSRCFQL